jgi:acetyl esterase/lipase
MKKMTLLAYCGLLVFSLLACNLLSGTGGISSPSQSNSPWTPTGAASEVMADTVFSGYAFVDTNGNSKLDEGDLPLEGAKFTLTGFGETTDQNGFAMVLIPGDWNQSVIARMDPPDGSGYILIGSAEQTLQNGIKNRADYLFASPEAEKPSAAPPVQIDLTYCTPLEGIKLTMDVYNPKNGGSPHPVIVYVHGGGWTGGDKSDGIGLLLKEELIQRGYLFVAINYRLAPKYSFPDPIEDVKCAVRYLRANAAQYNLDPDRIGALGGSAGGHLVGLLGTSDAKAGWDEGEYAGQSSRVQAVVDMYGPADLVALFPSSNRLQSQQIFKIDSAEELSRFSPVTYVSPDDPPFLILHGELDEVVPLEQSQIFYDKLKAAGIPVELVVVKNAGHSFQPQGEDIQPSLPELFQTVSDFFDQNLKEKN